MRTRWVCQLLLWRAGCRAHLQPSVSESLTALLRNWGAIGGCPGVLLQGSAVALGACRSSEVWAGRRRASSTLHTEGRAPRAAPWPPAAARGRSRLRRPGCGVGGPGGEGKVGREGKANGSAQRQRCSTLFSTQSTCRIDLPLPKCVKASCPSQSPGAVRGPGGTGKCPVCSQGC